MEVNERISTLILQRFLGNFLPPVPSMRCPHSGIRLLVACSLFCPCRLITVSGRRRARFSLLAGQANRAEAGGWGGGAKGLTRIPRTSSLPEGVHYLSRWCGRVPTPVSIRSECSGLSYVMQCLLSSLSSKRGMYVIQWVFRKHRRIIPDAV
jgi:hypothetical protein